MSQPGKFRVVIYTVAASGRGRDQIAAIIDDAIDIGCSEYINDGGEFFMTLPNDHPQIAQLQPLKRHFAVLRWNGSGYTEIFNGLLTDMDSTPDETIFYGENYLNLLATTIDNNLITYSNQEIGTIFTAEFSNARDGDNTTQSRLGFVTTGTVDTTGQSTTVIVAYTPRLGFLQGLASIVSSSTTALPIFYISRSSPFTFEFRSNHHVVRENVLLEYGSTVNDFRYIPYGPNFATYQRGVGQKREGSTVLYSTRSWAPESEYGHIARAKVYIDVVDQTALDRSVEADARRLGTRGQDIAIALTVRGIDVWDGYDLGDRLRVRINRGPTQVDALYILTGLRWIGKKDGTEDLFFDLVPDEHTSCNTVTEYGAGGVWDGTGGTISFSTASNAAVGVAGTANITTSTVSQATYSAIIMVDLNSSLKITGLHLNMQYSGWTAKIQSSDNSTTWTDAYDFKGKPPGLDVDVQLNPSVTARYWRVLHTYTGTTIPPQSYNYIGVFGCPA